MQEAKCRCGKLVKYTGSQCEDCYVGICIYLFPKGSEQGLYPQERKRGIRLNIQDHAGRVVRKKYLS